MKHTLLPSFIHYMESTQHLVLYRLDSMFSIPSTFCMPHVNTIAVIDSEPDKVSAILYRQYFPHLQRVHYLSQAPSDPLIYQRFPHLGFMGWVFPYLSQPYCFYDRMTEAGWGKRDKGLINNYIVSRHEYSSEKSSRPHFDLYLPSRGIVTGQFYRDQLFSYFQKKQCDDFSLPYPVLSEDPEFTETIHPSLTSHCIYDSRWIYHQKRVDRMFEKYVLNLPDATPFHNSNK